METLLVPAAGCPLPAMQALPAVVPSPHTTFSWEDLQAIQYPPMRRELMGRSLMGPSMLAASEGVPGERLAAGRVALQRTERMSLLPFCCATEHAPGRPMPPLCWPAHAFPPGRRHGPRGLGGGVGGTAAEARGHRGSRAGGAGVGDGGERAWQWAQSGQDWAAEAGSVEGWGVWEAGRLGPGPGASQDERHAGLLPSWDYSWVALPPLPSARLWAALCGALSPAHVDTCAAHPPLSAPPRPGPQIVHSRSFGSPGQGGAAVRMLVPLVDLLNHAGDEAHPGAGALLGGSAPRDNVRWGGRATQCRINLRAVGCPAE